MTWPPPPPSSDPWASAPDPDRDTSGEPHADPVVEPEPQPEPEPAPVDAGHTAAPEFYPPPAPPMPDAPPPMAPMGPPPDPVDGGWPSFHNAPPPVIPRSPMAPPPSKKPIWLAAAAVAAILVIGLVLWLLLPSGGDDTAQPATTTTTSAPPSADPKSEARLLRILPAGYRAGTCEAVAPPSGARAAASCGPNLDPGGPVAATYTVTEDGPALDTAFNAVVNGSTRVNCPGNIQSPGPWRRNATPQKVSGVLFCGIQQNRPIVAWTNVDESVVAVVESGPQGPTMEQLYAWWGSHS